MSRIGAVTRHIVVRHEKRNGLLASRASQPCNLGCGFLIDHLESDKAAVVQTAAEAVRSLRQNSVLQVQVLKSGQQPLRSPFLRNVGSKPPVCPRWPEPLARSLWIELGASPFRVTVDSAVRSRRSPPATIFLV
jgi:hypothetical protein